MATQTDVTAIVSQQFQRVLEAEFGETRVGYREQAIKRFIAWMELNRRRALSRAAIPNPLLFAPSINAHLKIEKPFTVRIERSSGLVTAYAEEIGEFGEGAHVGEALEDLRKTIGELYLSLEELAANLGPDLQAVRAKLNEHVKRLSPRG